MATALPPWRWYHWLSANRLRSWAPTALTLLSGAGVAFLFMTDWKVILTRVPYIRGRFPPEEDTAPAGEEDTAAAGEEE